MFLFFDTFRAIGEKDPPSMCSILMPDAPPPTPPVCPPQRLVREQLLPPTPSVHLEAKKHAFSPQLQEFCLKHPIAVVRGMANALELGNLFYKQDYFKTKFTRCKKNYKAYLNFFPVILFPSVPIY